MSRLHEFPGCSPGSWMESGPCSMPSPARKIGPCNSHEVVEERGCVTVRREHRSFRTLRMNDTSIPLEEATLSTLSASPKFAANNACPYVDELRRDEVVDDEHIKIGDESLDLQIEHPEQKIPGTPSSFSRIEFLAKRAPDAAPGAVRMTVLCNDTDVLAKDVVLGAEYRLLILRSHVSEIRNIIFWVNGAADSGGVHLDVEFGLRVDGSDVSHTLRSTLPSVGTALPKPLIGDPNRAMDAIEMGPGRYVAELSIEFVACGLSGEEVVDVYVNNFSSPCEIGAKIPMRSESPQLFRYVLCPMNVSISCILIQVRHASSPPMASSGKPTIFHGKSTTPRGASATTPRSVSALGRASDSSSSMVIMDPTVGVRVAMQDCLASTTLVNPSIRSSTQVGLTTTTYSESSKSKVLLRTGQWRTQGMYRLLPYLCTKKPYKSKRHLQNVAEVPDVENGCQQSLKDILEKEVTYTEEDRHFSSAVEDEESVNIMDSIKDEAIQTVKAV